MVKGYSRSKDGNQFLEDNFRVKEFACKDGSDSLLIDTTLTSVLQIVRNHFKAPVTINSAYRTKTHNKQVGGTDSSKHLLGQAADIVVSGVAPVKVYNYLNGVMEGWGGLILYNNKKFVHVDVRKQAYREVIN